MATWVKETATAIYLMEGGYYIDKIVKAPSKSGNGEKVINATVLQAWFARPDAPGAMSVTQDGLEPAPKPGK